MKHIRKNPANEPETLRSYRLSTPDATYSGYTDGIPTPRNEAETHARPLKESLCEEQGRVCCYCMRRISAHTCSVEHYLPQTRSDNYPVEYEEIEEGLNYLNMLASCNDSFRNCSGIRGNAHLHVDPRKEYCESIFKFKLNGEIIVANDMYQSTYGKDITTLNLNEQRLRNNRQEVIDKLRADFQKGKYDTAASIERKLNQLRTSPYVEYALVAEQYLAKKLASR